MFLCKVIFVMLFAICCRTCVPLLSLLMRGLSMSADELSMIVPLVSVFSALFSHVLTLMHDVEFFKDQHFGQSHTRVASLKQTTLQTAFLIFLKIPA